VLASGTTCQRPRSCESNTLRVIHLPQDGGAKKSRHRIAAMCKEPHIHLRLRSADSRSVEVHCSCVAPLVGDAKGSVPRVIVPERKALLWHGAAPFALLYAANALVDPDCRRFVGGGSSRDRRPVHIGSPTALVQARTNLLPATRTCMKKPLGAIHICDQRSNCLIAKGAIARLHRSWHTFFPRPDYSAFDSSQTECVLREAARNRI
jgi:hypothetical protein